MDLSVYEPLLPDPLSAEPALLCSVDAGFFALGVVRCARLLVLALCLAMYAFAAPSTGVIHASGSSASRLFCGAHQTDDGSMRCRKSRAVSWVRNAERQTVLFCEMQ